MGILYAFPDFKEVFIILKLASIFSDNALFLHSSKLTVRGEAKPLSEVFFSLVSEKDGKVISHCSSKSNENGKFSVETETPAASFDTYMIRVFSCGEESVSRGILFGELWLASGQSNMELPNYWCYEFDEMAEFLKDKPIRVYNTESLEGNAKYPRRPLDDYQGVWAKGDNLDVWRIVSATATAFSKHLYLYFKEKGKCVPVGFVNASRGAANIECWIPESAVINEKKTIKYLKERDLYPTDENYNQKGDMNYNQLGCHYNFKIHPTHGVRYRGVLWYQGESNIFSHAIYGNYPHLLKKLRDSYEKIFSAGGNSPFPLIASHIYPWAFNSCYAGLMNVGITSLAEKYPSQFSFIPVYDFKCTWNFAINNHPIHPIHKYEHGARCAVLAENILYGRGGRGIQKNPATLKKWSIDGEKIVLEFKNVGRGLYIRGEEARGLYIRSEKSVYTKAYARVVGKNKIEVSHPYIKEPVAVSYSMNSFEHNSNIFAGEFPVTPFTTEKKGKNGVPFVDIKVKNWLYPELDSEVWICENDRNVFPRAIFHPSQNSEIGFDSAFSKTARSIRIRGSEEGFGCYVLSHKFRELDIQNYSELRLSVLNSKDLTLTLRLHYEEKQEAVTETVENIIHKQGSIASGKEIDAPLEAHRADISKESVKTEIFEIKAEKIKEYGSGWSDMRICFDSVPDGKIEKMEFFIKIGEGNHLRTTALIDKLILIPKQ